MTILKTRIHSTKERNNVKKPTGEMKLNKFTFLRLIALVLIYANQG